MSTIMSIPTELFDHIFGILATDPRGRDIKTLKACNLVSSTIAAICEPHLYGCIYLALISKQQHNDAAWCLQSDQYDPQCRISITRFKEIVACRPQIVRYVRRLGVMMLQSYNSAQANQWWEAVGSVLDTLMRDQIEWFKLYSNTKIEFSTLPATIQRCLLDVIKSPALHTLHIFRIIGIPILDLASHLKTLRYLDAVGWDIVPQGQRSLQLDASSRVTIPIKILILRYGVHEMVQELIGLRNQDGLPAVDLASLTSLYFGRMNKASQEVAWSILFQTKKLKSLTLTSSMYLHSFKLSGSSFIPALASLKNTLQTLTVVWQPEAYAIFHDVANFLQFESPSSTCSLNALTILRLIIQAPPDYGEVHPETGWERTAAVVCNKDKFPCLTTVALYIGSMTRAQAQSHPVEHYLNTARKELEPRLKDRHIRLEFLECADVH